MALASQGVCESSVIIHASQLDFSTDFSVLCFLSHWGSSQPPLGIVKAPGDACLEDSFLACLRETFPFQKGIFKECSSSSHFKGGVLARNAIQTHS